MRHSDDKHAGTHESYTQQRAVTSTMLSGATRKLVVDVKHLAGSKLLRHATVKRLAT